MSWLFNLFAVLLFLGFKGKEILLAGFGSEAVVWEIQLHTGIPGTEGKEKIAEESSKKKFSLQPFAVGHEYRRNNAAIEWAEVKATETYTYFSIWNNAGEFIGYGKIKNSKGEEIGVPVEKGDTFKINKESLEITVE